jgi:hypothetical protein
MCGSGLPGGPSESLSRDYWSFSFCKHEPIEKTTEEDPKMQELIDKLNKNLRTKKP